jgi:hypothetical protein
MLLQNFSAGRPALQRIDAAQRISPRRNAI